MRRSMDWKSLGAIGGVLVALLGLAGCGDDTTDEGTPPVTDPCANITNCTTIGERKCNDEGTSVLICQENASGCAVWATERSCGAHATCESGACSCDDTCDTLGATQCNGDIVESCTTDAVGCRYWSTYTDCAQSGKVCDASGEAAVCVGTCTNDCDESGALQCSGDLLQTCTASTDGCLHWVTTEDCAASDPPQTCDDTGATPACSSSCTDACPSDGATQCEGDTVQTCVEGADGCLAWETTTDCGENTPAQTCDESSGTAVCADSCQDACPAENDTQCSGALVQTCTMGGNGCLGWETTTDCATTSQVCDATSGTATCVDGCQDTCPAENDTQCSGDLVQTCTEGANGCLGWETTTDCTTTSQVCSATSGTATCVDACQNTCPAEDDTQCSGDLVQTCTADANGCLSWVTTTDCAENTPAQTCDASSGTAVCADSCQDACPAANDTQCNGDVVETCTMGANGCLGWVTTTDCAASTPAQTCDASGGTAVCVGPAEGEACVAPQVITLPFQAAGTNFTTDYANDHDFSDGTDCSDANGSEAVFQLTMAAGQTIRIQELTLFDAVIRVLSVCTDTNATCLVSEDFDEDFLFTAPTAGDYFIVLESYSVSPTNAAWDFTITEVPPETNCTNDLDDDLDEAIDCADTDCFGVAGACEAETGYCDDNADNDDDTLIDCDDPDCDADPVCQVPQGIFEAFSTTNPNDLEGCSVTFTPNAASPAGYDLTGSCACAPAWLTVPGTGTATTALTLGDSASSEYTFTQLPGFPFYGTTYTSMFVGSNGFVTFGAGDNYSAASTSDYSFFLNRRIAGLAADLNPGAGGTITVDDFADRVVVTFDGVRFYAATTTVEFQIVMQASGAITIVYLGIDNKTTGRAGIANGTATGTIPPASDLLDAARPPTTAGDLVITEVQYNDEATTVEGDGEFIEIYNSTDAPLDLDCCVLGDLTGTFDVPALTVVEPGAYAVFVRNDVEAENGGIVGGIAYGNDIQLRNGDAETISITCGGVVIDTLPFNTSDPWPAGGNGASMQLASQAIDADANDTPSAWCTSTAAYGAGDLGTPGAANAECTFTPVASFDFETNPSWTVAGDWAWGAPDAAYTDGPAACAGGVGCYGTNLSGAYANNTSFATNYLEAQFDLSGVGAAILDFDMWLVTEASWDYATVLYSIDGGTTWLPVPMASPAYNGTGSHQNEWQGSVASTWTPASGSLTAAAGIADVRVRWALDADSTTTAPGFYVDNVVVSGL